MLLEEKKEYLKIMNENNKYHNAKILIVDDNEINIILIEKVLRKSGYKNIKTTTDSTNVLNLYQSNNFDLILLDLRMPNMDGFEVLDALKKAEQNSYLPVIVLTADSDRDVRINALAKGAKDFITKPIDQLETLTRIENMLEVRFLHNQIRNQNIILEEKVAERTAELYESRLEIIQKMTKASEYRDNETGNHILRISKYSEILGKKMNLTAKEIDLIINASPMHDVGKIGISDNILLKPGKLTEEEWDIMRKHTIIGHDILADSRSDLLKQAAEIALYHHEKWDGTGYPYGKKSLEIPLFARIVAVVDVFDALTSERPYKKGWPVEEAVDEIIKLKGIHFDPEIIDVFQQSVDDFRNIQATYKDK